MKKSIMVVGPVLSRSGYGEQARFALKSLKSFGEFEVFIHNIPWGQTGWIDHDHPFRAYVDERIEKTNDKADDFVADLSLQITVPNEFKMYCPINIGYTAGIETDRVDKNWIIAANMTDGLIVPSEHSAAVFKNTSALNEQGKSFSLEKKIKVVNYPFENKQSADLNLDLIKTKFNFLAVAQMSHRKNILNMIEWFCEEFQGDEEVGLVLKLYTKNCSTIDRHRTFNKIKSLLETASPDRQNSVYLLHGDLNPFEMNSLYKNKKIHAFLTTSHGEGFGLPIFEAAANGLIVIAPDWSGQKDFLYTPKRKKQNGKLVNKIEPCFVKLEFKIKKVEKPALWPGVINEDAQWAFPDKNSFKKAIRKVYKKPELFRPSAKVLAENIKKEFTFEKKSKEFIEAIQNFIKEKEKK